MSDLKAQLTSAMKEAMRAKDSARLAVIRMALAAIKQVEIDERIEVDDTRALAILDKQVKQRLDSARQYLDAGRQELADIEQAEIEVLREFLPAPLSQAEIDTLIEQAIADSGAAGMQDMGKVMALLKPAMQGRADMAAVSGRLKARLTA
ncbi:GatB/YqeY domain-containing protein [Alcanivorax quisquiliarum]|uniref:GatB/YqeY domain-containing protein n=1 Tax=Alcanivorax quisquiliarum TaxID=2933565 RepID=A0ABT0E6I8_9GAMM|nr:GatB/YqeY domain-containing protein [Alcanivorax quisquiliarum]MCK0537407.1 GatB/YqeY domain-containing protein [Alcanivorax quisquiliarum]